MNFSPKLFLALASATLFTSCFPVLSRQSLYEDSYASVTDYNLWIFPAFHSGDHYYTARVLGRSYTRIRGTSPFYLKIPKKDLILFVTGPKGNAIVHLVNVKTQMVQDIPAHDSEIGSYIGVNRSDTFERVASCNGDLLVIQARFGSFKYRYLIDLRTATFLKEEQDRED